MASTRADGSASEKGVPILLYHRFGPVVADSMTVTTPHFESQLKYYLSRGYTVISLRELVDYYLGERGSIPPRSLVITADDGHKSVYADMFPLLKRYHVPATLFIYPSAISNVSYALTWDELKEMKDTGLVAIQSHTFWHPNFRNEKKKLNHHQYEKFLDGQLRKSREKLEGELQVKVDMLAWPFGIYDEELMKKAAQDGYVAAFTMERHDSKISDKIMALPRYLMVDAERKR
jgi:peptidoglycan/xylan/chitin deacetylase (PgdA/CDA1 family)